MSQEQTQAQAVVQAGPFREAASVGSAVGGVHSSQEDWSWLDLHGLSAEYRAWREEWRRDSARSQACQRSKGEGDGSVRAEIRTPEKIRKLQRALYRKAKAEPKYRFWSLYGDLMRRDLLEHAFQRVARNKGGPGVEGQTVASITQNEERKRQWLDALQEELKTKKYWPSPVLRVWILKNSGGLRPLGIPTLKDRVVQMAAMLVLMPIFEADFHRRSFGFRPKRNAHQAIEEIVRALRQGRLEVVDADVSNYFDTIPQRALIDSREGFTFLGFIVRWQRSRRRGRWYSHVQPSAKSEQHLRDAVRPILNHWTEHRRIPEVVEELNILLRGWSGYFHFRHSTQVMWDLQGWVRRRFKGWLWRKHGRTQGKWKGYPDELLHGRYGLWRMPTRAAWKDA